MAAAAVMQQARIAIREGRLVDARRLLRQVIHEEPKNHAAWLLLARATPDKKLASQYIDRARHLQPDSPLVQRAEEDLASNKTAATNKFSYSWLLIPLLVGTALILGLVGVSYSKNGREQVVLTANEGVNRVAAAPAESVQDEPTKIPETNAVLLPTPKTNSPQIIPTAVPSAQIDNEAIEETGETQGVIFEPVVISDPGQALPAAILMGIDTEASSSEPTITTEEQVASSISSTEDATDEETGIEAPSEAETGNPNEITDVADPADPEEASSEEASNNEASNNEGPGDEAPSDGAPNDEAPNDGAPIDGGADTEEEIQDLEEPGSEVRVEDDAASSDPTQPAPGERWIDVNLTTQTLTAYEGDTAVLYSAISSGMWQFPTVTGQFRTWIKYETQDMTGYHLGYNYSLDNVPHVMYFFEDYAIHGAYWHNNFGTPMSHGCVNVNLPDAEWLYDWAPLGTIVDVHH